MDNLSSDVKRHSKATQLHTWPTTSSSVWNLMEKLSSSSKSVMLFWLSRSLWRLLLRPLLAWLCRSPRPKSDAAPLRRAPVQTNGRFKAWQTIIGDSRAQRALRSCRYCTAVWGCMCHAAWGLAPQPYSAGHIVAKQCRVMCRQWYCMAVQQLNAPCT